MTPQIAIVLFILVITIILFITEKLRVDVIALMVMVTLPWFGLIAPQESFLGLSSNAVISIMGVMILGYGIDKSGVMSYITGPIIRLAGKSEKRLMAIISSAVGILSAFIQNIGATALFLPAVIKISKDVKLHTSKILMPIGFSAILGGTLTLFGSGPLIILNDLLKKSGAQTFGVFDVTPIGLTLLFAGIVYFIVMGRWILPNTQGAEKQDEQDELIKELTLPEKFFSARGIADNNTIEDLNLWEKYKLHLVVLVNNNDIIYSPWRQHQLKAKDILLLSGEEEDFQRFVADHSLEHIPSERKDIRDLKENLAYARTIIPPNSSLVGKTMRQFALRRNFEIEPIVLQKEGRTIQSDFSNQTLQPGDILIVHGSLSKLWKLKSGKDLIILTPLKPLNDDKRKPLLAIIGFVGAIGLALAGFQLSLCLFTGAIFMILTKVINIDEAYKAIDWRTIFLLAGLIPLGTAMQKTGAAEYIATNLIGFFSSFHPIIILAALSVLVTIFTLFMSNVAATVLLVPLVAIMGSKLNMNPAALGLLVAVMASNSFLLPTHQVNAFLMGPGGYRNKDYIKAGSVMSLLFITITITMIYFFYL